MGTLSIPLTRGKFVLIDEEDAPLITPHKWTANWTGRLWYAYRWRKKTDPPGSSFIYMHNAICPGGKADRINGDTLDNRRSNLRLATRSQNGANMRLSKRNKSGYKGVTFHEASQKWRAGICVRRKQIHLGLFETKEEAAEAYRLAALEYFGEYAKF